MAPVTIWDIVFSFTTFFKKYSIFLLSGFTILLITEAICAQNNNIPHPFVL